MTFLMIDEIDHGLQPDIVDGRTSKIGVTLKKEWILTEHEWRLRKEYNSFTTFERVFGDRVYYAFQYSSQEDFEEAYPELFIG